MLRISMDEIAYAVCLNTAERLNVPVDSVAVDLLYDEDLGYSAEVKAQGRERILIEANIKEAIIRYVDVTYGKRVYPADITLDVEDEIWAEIAD